MATKFDKLKRRPSRLGPPPGPEEVKDNLEEPERAPVSESPPQDGRSARATGRTKAFSTRVKPGIPEKIKQIAVRDGITMGALVELAISGE